MMDVWKGQEGAKDSVLSEGKTAGRLNSTFWCKICCRYTKTDNELMAVGSNITSAAGFGSEWH